MFVRTGKNLVRMNVPLSVLKEKASSHGLQREGLWMTSIVDRYNNRADGAEFEDMCIATFASEFPVLCKNESSANRIALEAAMGFVLRRTQTQFAVVRYMQVSLYFENKEEEDVGRRKEAHYMSFLQLFAPYRTDAKLKPAGFKTYTLFYDEGFVVFSNKSVHSVKSVLEANRAKFEVGMKRLEKDQDLARDRGDLCPEQQVEHFDAVAERMRSLLRSS